MTTVTPGPPNHVARTGGALRSAPEVTARASLPALPLARARRPTRHRIARSLARRCSRNRRSIALTFRRRPLARRLFPTRPTAGVVPSLDVRARVPARAPAFAPSSISSSSAAYLGFGLRARVVRVAGIVASRPGDVSHPSADVASPSARF